MADRQAVCALCGADSVGVRKVGPVSFRVCEQCRKLDLTRFLDALAETCRILDAEDEADRVGSRTLRLALSHVGAFLLGFLFGRASKSEPKGATVTHRLAIDWRVLFALFLLAVILSPLVLLALRGLV